MNYWQSSAEIDVSRCVLLMTEEYHRQNGNIDQWLTLHQFKGCDLTQLLLSQDGMTANVELTDYLVMLASHTGLLCLLFENHVDVNISESN